MDTKQKTSKDDAKKRAKKNRLWKTYGLTLEEHAELIKNGCWICGKTDGILAVDHVHIKNYKKLDPECKTTFVRGCLCFWCNKYLVGCVDRRNDGRFLLCRLVAYFAIYPMKADYLNEDIK